MIKTLAYVFATLLSLGAAAHAEPKRVLVFGDSNSWGWVPSAEGVPTRRYPTADQWPEVTRKKLGADYEIVVDALSGRTTDVDDPTAPMGGAALNGAEYLPAAIAAHLPLDLVVIMLGTNDTKAVFKRTPFQIALGAGRLVGIVQSSANMFGGGWYSYAAPKVLLLAPPPMAKQTVFSDTFEGEVGVDRSKGLAAAYKGIAAAAAVDFFDAGTVIVTDGVDGVHFSADTQHKLGDAMANEIKRVLQ